MPPTYRVELIRCGRRRKIRLWTAADVAAILSKHLAGADREHFVVVLVDAASNLIGINTVSIGTLLSADASAREVFKPAILANAASIILGHNHPSGEPTPSPEDIALTARLKAAGEILDIAVLDHVIIGGDRFTSFRKNGYI